MERQVISVRQRGLSLRRYNTSDKNTRDREGIGLNYGPRGPDQSKIAERAIKSEDLPSYLGGAVFQNGSACFRLHVRHSAGEGRGGCGGCRNPGMLLVSHREGKKQHVGTIRARKPAPAATEAATVQQVPAAGPEARVAVRLWGTFTQTARIKCNFNVCAVRPSVQKPSLSRDVIVKNVF